jgi:putative nucleotidyltransferase with HDIG domain
MLNILFLQSDQQYRHVLEASLARELDNWNVYFAQDAASAWSRLETTPIDVFLADGTAANGNSLVEKVRESFPDVIRIALVNQAWSRKPGMSNFHQFLITPFAVKELEVAVERSCRLRDLLRGEAMAHTVGGLGQLPAAPTVYMKLVDKLNRPDASIDTISEIIEDDVAISAKLLQLVNSALFRTSREIATVQLATSYLGLTVIKNLVLSTEVFRFFENKPEMALFSIEQLQSHSQLTAKIAGELNLTAQNREAAIVAGLLHDIGKLVLAWKMPDRLIRLMTKAQAQDRPLYQVEEELWGITHAEIGAYLLGLWGLPTAITEAVAYHHSPAKVPHHHFDALGAVYVANILAHEQDGSATDVRAAWDIPVLEEMGVADHLPAWRELACGIRV